MKCVDVRGKSTSTSTINLLDKLRTIDTLIKDILKGKLALIMTTLSLWFFANTPLAQYFLGTLDFRSQLVVISPLGFVSRSFDTADVKGHFLAVNRFRPNIPVLLVYDDE